MIKDKYKQKLVNGRMSKGLCIDCGSPLDREGIRCSKCCRKQADKNNKARHWYAEHKICPRCRKNDLVGDEKNCPECRAKFVDIAKRSRAKRGQEYNAYMREYQKKRLEELRDKGICVRCCKAKATQGYKTCEKCRDKYKNFYISHYSKPDRKERYKEGLCYYCDEKVKDGYKVCEKHYQRNCENARSPKLEEVRRKKSEYWSKQMKAYKKA